MTMILKKPKEQLVVIPFKPLDSQLFLCIWRAAFWSVNLALSVWWMFEGKKREKKASSGSTLPQRLGYDTYHSINLFRAHYPRDLVEFFRRHGEQVFWRLEPGRVAEGRRRAGKTLQWGSEAQLGYRAGSEATRATTEVSWEEAHEPHTTLCKASAALNENWHSSLTYLLNKQVQ